jgi:TetR/AcrR family transcriptional regulator, regulator of biofilm formation and stress response
MKSNPTTRDRAGVPQAILDAALRLVGQGGTSALTHRRVAEIAGVSLSATTYYFRSKAQILEQALFLAAERELTELSAVHDLFDPATMTLEEWAARLARVLAAETKGKRRVMLLAQFEMDLYAARHPRLRAAVRELNARYSALIEPVLVRLGAREPATGARLFVAAVTGLLLEQASCPMPDFADGVLAPAIVALLTADLAGRHPGISTFVLDQHGG